MTVGDALPDVEGMLQINDLRAAHVPTGLPAMESQLWRNMREVANNIPQARSSPVALVKFIYHDNQAHAKVSPTILTPDAFMLARDRTPITLKTVISGIETKLPKTSYTYLEMLNTHIRMDRKNQLLLHVPMNDVEKEVVRQALGSQIEGESTAVTLMRKKMGRESTFGGTQPVN